MFLKVFVFFTVLTVKDIYLLHFRVPMVDKLTFRHRASST